MNAQDEKRIELLLSQIKLEKAPFGFEDSVMGSIEVFPQIQRISLIDRVLSYLLVFSLVAVTAAVIYFVGFERIQLFLSGLALSGLSWLDTDNSIFESLVRFFTQIPPLVVLVFVILAFLLGAERIMLRKRQTNTFLSLI